MQGRGACSDGIGGLSGPVFHPSDCPIFLNPSTISIASLCVPRRASWFTQPLTRAAAPRRLNLITIFAPGRIFRPFLQSLWSLRLFPNVLLIPCASLSASLVTCDLPSVYLREVLAGPDVLIRSCLAQIYAPSRRIHFLLCVVREARRRWINLTQTPSATLGMTTASQRRTSPLYFCFSSDEQRDGESKA